MRNMLGGGAGGGLGSEFDTHLANCFYNRGLIFSWILLNTFWALFKLCAYKIGEYFINIFIVAPNLKDCENFMGKF